jgi:hypothetical protein
MAKNTTPPQLKKTSISSKLNSKPKSKSKPKNSLPTKLKKVSFSKKNKPKTPPKVNISNELQRNFVKRIFFYTFFSVLTLSLTFLVYFRTKGYTFNTSGQVEHRGIVLINSSPIESTIFFDGKQIKQTEAKIEATEGNHQVSLQAKGYRTWQRSFQMRAQNVKWFYYPYLIPDQIPTTPFLTNQTPKLYSPRAISKSQLVAVSIAESKVKLELLNLTQDPRQALSTINIPEGLFSKNSAGTYGQFKFLEWSPDSDSLLIEHQFDQTSELINLRINSPQQSSNLTRILSTPITEAHFNPSSKLNLLVGGELRQYNPTNLNLEQTIASNLTSFSSFEDQVYLYTKTSTTPADSQNLELYIQQNSSTPVLITKLNTLDLGQIDYTYLVNRRSSYLAVSNSSNKELQIFKNPLQDPSQNPIQSPSQNPTDLGTQLTAKPALYLRTFSQFESAKLKLSPTGSSQPGRYLAIQTTGSNFFIYDFDSEEALSYSLKTSSKTEQTTEQELNITSFDWLDPHHLQVQDSNGDIYYLDYDGNYLNLIASGAPIGLSSFVGSKGYGFIITNSTDGSATQNITKLNFKLE